MFQGTRLSKARFFKSGFFLSCFAAVIFFLLGAFISTARANEWDDCLSRDVNRIAVGCTAIITQNERSSEDIVKAYIARAGSYYRQKLFEQALADLNEALVRAPRSVDALVGRGDVNHRKNKLDDAMADYAAALEIDPKKDRKSVV